MTSLAPMEALYAEHTPAARRLALSLVPAHAAEDVVAEAFTRVVSAVRRGRGPRGPFRPYLLAAVRNQASDFYSGRHRLVPVPDIEPGPAPSPEQLCAEHEDARLAVRAFATLPERWQWVLWATAVDERAPAELAAEAGMSANGISQLASRAREGLRQAYLNEHVRRDLGPGCREVAPFMGAAVRGKAGQRHQAQLSAHLRGCEPCGAAYDGLRGLNNHLGELLVPAAVSGSALLKVLHAARPAARAGLRAHWPAVLTASAVTGLAAALTPMVVPGGAVSAGPPGAGAPGTPGSLPVEPGSGSPVLADGPGAPVVLPGGLLPGSSLPGGIVPGAESGSLPGGVLPGTSSPGGLLPGSSLPGGVVTSAGAAVTAAPLAAVSTGADVAAGSPGGELAGPMVTSASQAAGQQAAGSVSSLLPG